MSHGGRPVNILRSEEMQGIIAHFENRRRLYFSIFALGFFAGYPAAEMIIEWLLETDGFVPEGVELIVLQPLEVVLLQLRIASQIAIGMTIGAIILDLSWVSNRRVSGDYSLIGEAISGVLLSIIMIIILGIFGIAEIPLDMMTITIAAITIGIAVDNSIHYIYRFKEEFNKSKNYLRTLEVCHSTVGIAILNTSITIIFGFSILVLSNFIPTIYFGIFTGIAMLLAMISVLTLLPSLLLVIKPFGVK